MKIHGIVFSGVMSAILMSVAGADAATSLNLASKDYVDTKLEAKQNVLTAGAGIDITDNVVKSTIDTSGFLKRPDIEGLATDGELAAVKKALQDEIAAKHAAGDYATVGQLTDLQQKIDALQGSNVDKTVVEGLQASVAAISADYAKKSDLTATEERLQKSIDSIVIPDLADYATKVDLQDKANASELTTLQQTVSNIENTYVTKQVAQNTYMTEEQVVQQITNVVGDDSTGLKKQVTDNTDAIAKNAQEIALKANAADVESTYATKQSLETIGGRVDVLENSDFQTGDDVQGAITTATKDLATKTDLGDYAKSSELAEVATTGSYNSLSDRPDIPSIEGLATSAELTALEALVNAKAAQADMTAAQGAIAEVQTAISNLQSGKADVATVTALQNAVNNLGNTYASDAELAAAIEGVVALIPTVPTVVSAFENDAGYITNSALAGYATKSEIPSVDGLAEKSYVDAELAKKANASALDDLVTSEQLAKLRTDLEAEIAKKQASGDYATSESLQAISNSLADYAKASSVYTKAEVDDMIANAASGGNVDLSGYAKTSALEALQELVNGKQDAITDLSTIRAGAEKGATAVQPDSITTGTENGSIAVNGTDVPVKGLSSAAYASVDSLVEKPALPTENGDYMLMVNYADGTHTYSWTNINDYWREDDDTNLWN